MISAQAPLTGKNKTKYDGTEARRPRVVIVGGGLAGLITAIQLKTKLNFHDFTIYEKEAGVGGTWRVNTYPGCGSDVPGHWYSLSTELNPYWQSYFASQPEILAYWENLWHKHSLEKHTQANTFVRSAVWSNETQRYTLSLENLKTGQKSEVEAEITVWAIGGFQAPLYPKDIVGMESFRGELFHSARWRDDVALEGKRVGVIGNGCSAAQFIPEISKDPSVQVMNFCRTPQWFVQRGNYTYPKWAQWMFAHLPLVMRIYRNWIMARSDISFLIFRKSNKPLIWLGKKVLAGYIKKKAPKEEWKNLIPTYGAPVVPNFEFTPGCKRIIVDPGYLKSLNRPNVSLKWDAIDAIVGNGIRLKTGEVVPLDVIIFGTGYSIEPADLDVRGSRGTTILEYFQSKGGPHAYLGSCMPGFPNLFTLLGPNVASGHASVIFSEEAQINHALELMKPVLEGKAKSFEILEGATDEYNDWLQRRLMNSVWIDCVSYYQAGRNSKTRIVATFPGPVTLFWWFCRHPRWEIFKANGADVWKQEMKRDIWRKRMILVITLLATMGIEYVLSSKYGSVRNVLEMVLNKITIA